MTEQGTELVTEAGRRLVRAMQAEGRVTGNNGSLTEPIAAIESEARRLALAEGLDVERLAAALNEWQSEPDRPVLGARWDIAEPWDREQVERLAAILARGGPS